MSSMRRVAGSSGPCRAARSGWFSVQGPSGVAYTRNGTFAIEEEYLSILDSAIDAVRNEVEAREKMPLFDRQTR